MLLDGAFDAVLVCLSVFLPCYTLAFVTRILISSACHVIAGLFGGKVPSASAHLKLRWSFDTMLQSFYVVFEVLAGTPTTFAAMHASCYCL